MIGLSAVVYCCFQLSLCLAGPIMRVGIYVHLFDRKLALTFFIQRLQTFFIFVMFLMFFNVFYFFGNVFSSMVLPAIRTFIHK